MVWASFLKIFDGFLCSGCFGMPFQFGVVFSFMISVIVLFCSSLEISMFIFSPCLCLSSVCIGVHCDSKNGVYICSMEDIHVFGDVFVVQFLSIL